MERSAGCLQSIECLLKRTKIQPSWFPNSGPARVYICSATGAVQKALLMSPVKIFNLLYNATSWRSLIEMSCTVDDYVLCFDKSITCPPMTNLLLCRRSSRLTSKIMCMGANDHPCCLWHLWFDGWNSNTLSFFKLPISFAMESCHFVFLFSSSKMMACLML